MIRNYIPTGFTPRDEQLQLMDKMSACWADYDCFVLQGPPGVGKSLIAVTAALWAASFEMKTVICPPNRQLQQQYQRGFPWLAKLWGQEFHRCERFQQKCQDTHRKKKQLECANVCPYKAEVARARAADVVLMNPWAMMSQRMYPDLLILDEAHLIIDSLKEMAGVKLWRHLHEWPDNIRTAEDFVVWVQSKPYDKHRHKARKLVESDPSNVVLDFSPQLYFGKETECLRVQPLTCGKEGMNFWPPRKVKKKIFLDATYNDIDGKDAGLYNTVYIECGSPVHHTRRPIHYMPFVKVSHAQAELSVTQLAECIEMVLARHADAGIIHVTYEMAQQLRPLLTDSRLMWHDHLNKSKVFDDWRSGRAGPGQVLMASGMAVGIDLAGAIARWQVLTKVPSLWLGNQAVAFRAERDPEWYAWQTIKTLIQAYGRVCRGVDDWGETYIFDTNFERLYRDYEFRFPIYFREAVRWYA